jgi:hypothetical protein
MIGRKGSSWAICKQAYSRMLIDFWLDSSQQVLTLKAEKKGGGGDYIDWDLNKTSSEDERWAEIIQNCVQW